MSFQKAQLGVEREMKRMRDEVKEKSVNSPLFSSLETYQRASCCDAPRS